MDNGPPDAATARERATAVVMTHITKIINKAAAGGRVSVRIPYNHIEEVYTVQNCIPLLEQKGYNARLTTYNGDTVLSIVWNK